MIKIYLKYNNNLIDSIKIKGHAMYAPYGKDIVCASVSSIVITSVNAIIRLNSDSISYEEKDSLNISVLNHNNITDTLIDNMVSLLLELEKQYKKNIMINKEVCSC
ncbi:MAG: ribosomal-processing cysteine protease Prp [Bacilli bacterium]|nr:ribosomal-processing cysteine protease Prp [Bacilli bacterium]